MTNFDSSREQRLTQLRSELESLILSKGWGQKETDGKIKFEREEPAITGKAAQEFYEQSLARVEKYQHIVDAINNLITKYKIDHPFIIDMGTGPGLLPEKIAEAILDAKILGVDISEDMIRIAESRIQTTPLRNRIEYKKADSRRFYKQMDSRADLVVSRNMLHRLASLEDDLLSLVRASKDEGGITFVISFRNALDLDEDGLNRFIQEVKAREQYPDLQKAYALAFLNAPTLKQYEEAANRVAQEVGAESIVNPDQERNYVNIVLRKAPSTE